MYISAEAELSHDQLPLKACGFDPSLFSSVDYDSDFNYGECEHHFHLRPVPSVRAGTREPSRRFPLVYPTSREKYHPRGQPVKISLLVEES